MLYTFLFQTGFERLKNGVTLLTGWAYSIFILLLLFVFVGFVIYIVVKRKR